VVVVLFLLELKCCSGTFIFYFLYFPFFLAVCIRSAPGVMRCCRGWVYLVSIDINKFPLSKKKVRSETDVTRYMTRTRLKLMGQNWAGPCGLKRVHGPC
jgi:hypothetical protein